MLSRSALNGIKLPKNKLFSIIGAQWGDEGKGKIVDSLAPRQYIN